MRFLYGVVATLIVLGLGAVLLVYSGLYNLSATEDHTAMGDWVLHTAMHRSVKARTGDIEVPGNLVTEERVRQGARAYDQLCVACHLKPGQTDSLIRQGLNPTPPSLTAEGHWSAREQFWIIKNGIKMTGMPAWGETHEDRDLWQLTAFLQRLPALSEEQYAALVQPTPSGKVEAEADDGHDHEHMDMSAMTGSDNSNAGGSTGTMSDHHDEMADEHSGDDSPQDQGDSEHHQDESVEQEEPAEADAPSEEDGHYSDGHSH